MQDGRKAVWSIPYVSVAFFPSLKQNFIAYRSSKVSDCIFETHQLWQSGFSRVYSNSCCSCSFESEIIKIGQSSHQMHNNNIVNFQESMTILNACTKKVWKLIECTTYIYNPLQTHRYMHTHIHTQTQRTQTHNHTHAHTNYIQMIHHHHHHLVVPSARISLTLSRHPSLSFIASGRSSGSHPVSSQNCCM